MIQQQVAGMPHDSSGTATLASLVERSPEKDIALKALPTTPSTVNLESFTPLYRSFIQMPFPQRQLGFMPISFGKEDCYTTGSTDRKHRAGLAEVSRGKTNLVREAVDGQMRKGKWSPDEQKYTDRLMQAFKDGDLPLSYNVSKFSTLRGFLAERLHCDAMRITKKFAGGDSIGKQVYKPQHDKPSHAKTEEELDALERKFVESLKVALKRRAARRMRRLSSKLKKRSQQELLKLPSTETCTDDADVDAEHSSSSVETSSSEPTVCARPAKKFAREKSSSFQKGEWQAQYEAESTVVADNFDSLAEDERETAGLLLSFACSAEKKNRNGKRQMIISQ